MNENALYITLEQIPGGVRIRENYSSRFVSCLQQDYMDESMMILQGLVGVIDEINRDYLWDSLYRLFGCSITTMKRYIGMLAESSDADRLFSRGHGDYPETFKIEGLLPIQTSLFFSVSIEPIDSRILSLEIRDNIFKYAESEINSEINPVTLTAAAFAEILYRELYFPALKLLAGAEDTDLIEAFIDKSIDERFIPMA